MRFSTSHLLNFFQRDHGLDTNEINLSTTRSYGDDISNAALEGCIRIAFQNVHGIERGPDPFTEVTDAKVELGIDIFGAAETCVAWTSEFAAAASAVVRRRFGSGFAVGASTETKKHGFLPGGVMQTIRGNATGRNQQKGRDPLGRYVWMTLQGKNDKKLCIITMYRVCQQKGTRQRSERGNTAHWQQTKALIKRGYNGPIQEIRY